MSLLPLSLDSQNPRQVLRELWRTYSALKGIDHPGLDLNDRHARTVEDGGGVGVPSQVATCASQRGRRSFLTVEQDGKQQTVTEAAFPGRWTNKNEIQVTQLAANPSGGGPLYRTLQIDPRGNFAARIFRQELSPGEEGYPTEKVQELLARARGLTGDTV